MMNLKKYLSLFFLSLVIFLNAHSQEKTSGLCIGLFLDVGVNNFFTTQPGLDSFSVHEGINPNAHLALNFSTEYSISNKFSLISGITVSENRFFQTIGGLQFATDIINNTTSEIKANVIVRSIEIPLLASYNIGLGQKKSLTISMGASYIRNFKATSTRELRSGDLTKMELESLSYPFPKNNIGGVIRLGFVKEFNDLKLNFGCFGKKRFKTAQLVTSQTQGKLYSLGLFTGLQF